MKRDWTSRTALLIIGLILVVVNIIGLTLFGRLDLTDDKVYSLSEASIHLIENLEDPVTLKAFFTEDLPAPYINYRRFLRDKLADYRAYGGSNIQYEFVDPAEDEDLQQEANRFRIPPVQIQVIESDNVQLKNAYMGLSIQYAGKREVIPVIQDLSTLEYDITSAIRRLSIEELPVVGFLAGHGEPPAQQAMGTLYNQLSRNYTPKSITVNDSLPMLSEDPDALLIIAPTDSFPPHHLQAIDSYLVQGGKIGVLINRVDANLQTGQATVLDTGLETLLARYGASVSPNLVMDKQSSAITVTRQQGFFNVAQQIEYPFLPVATNFNMESMMVNRLSNLVFYFASTIDTSAVLPETISRDPLIYTTSRSQVQEGFFMLQPEFAQQSAMTDGPFLVGAAYTGEFPSYYGDPNTSPEGRLVVVGDGDFVNETIVGAVPGNIEFGLNLVDWMIQDEALLSIRSKKIEPRTLGETPESIRPWIKNINLIGPILFIMLFGLFRWRQRKARQIVIQAEIQNMNA